MSAAPTVLDRQQIAIVTNWMAATVLLNAQKLVSSGLPQADALTRVIETLSGALRAQDGPLGPLEPRLWDLAFAFRHFRQDIDDDADLATAKAIALECLTGDGTSRAFFERMRAALAAVPRPPDGELSVEALIYQACPVPPLVGLGHEALFA